MMTTEDRRKVLIIDDEADSRELIQQLLADKFEVLAADDGEEGLRMARAELPDVILLDISMPKLDGIAVCESLRTNEATRHIPIMMLTASTDANQRVQSFMTGADDFLPKPIKPKELLARILSKVRRIEEREVKEEVLKCGNLTLNLSKIEASLADKVVALTVLEFNLLKYFVQNKDRVVTRDRILEAVWRDSVVSDRTVDTHIVALRKKLQGFDHTLATIYGAGYVLKKE